MGELKDLTTQLVPSSCEAGGASAFFLFKPSSEGDRQIKVNTCQLMNWDTVLTVYEVSGAWLSVLVPTAASLSSDNPCVNVHVVVDNVCLLLAHVHIQTQPATNTVCIAHPVWFCRRLQCSTVERSEMC